MKSLDRRVEWSLKGVVTVKGRPDATSKTVELVVVPRELAQQPQPGTVTCKYCGTVYSQSLDQCPYCGAPRTA
jgi:rubrerythrin